MDVCKTRRGFNFIEFDDHYGEKCSLQQSSLASTECIWLGVDEANPKVMASEAKFFGLETEETTGWVDYPVPENVYMSTRMHLNRDQVKELLPHLQKFVETGEI